MNGYDMLEKRSSHATFGRPRRMHLGAPHSIYWQVGNGSGLEQMNAPFLVTGTELLEPILVHAVAAHDEPHRQGGRPRQRSSKHRHDQSHGPSVGSSTAVLLLPTVSLHVEAVVPGAVDAPRGGGRRHFVYMDVCGDSWSDTGEAPSWCWPHQPSTVCDGFDSPTGSKQWARKQAFGRCGSYCCGAAYGSQCGHFTLHAPMAAMRFDFRADGAVGANVTFFGGGSVGCTYRLKGQSWKYDTHRQLVDVKSTCLAKYWRAEKLEPPSIRCDKRENSLNVDFSHGGPRYAGWPFGYGIMLRVCPHPAHHNHTPEASLKR
jgi:hypothetical protein